MISVRFAIVIHKNVIQFIQIVTVLVIRKVKYPTFRIKTVHCKRPRLVDKCKQMFWTEFISICKFTDLMVRRIKPTKMQRTSKEWSIFNIDVIIYLSPKATKVTLLSVTQSTKNQLLRQAIVSNACMQITSLQQLTITEVQMKFFWSHTDKELC